MTLHMLVLIAAPLVHRTERGNQPIAPLAVQEELQAIDRACKTLDPPVALDIRVEIATAGALGRVFATNRAPFDILHFSGHGSVAADGTVLMLEDDHDLGAARPLGSDELGRLLGRNPCRLACLSACHSAGLAQTLLDLGVPHVVAISADDAVLDDAARSFAARLYPALLAGRSVAEAFERAVAAVQSDDALRGTFDLQTLQQASVTEPPKFQLLPADAPAHQQPLAAEPPDGTVRFPRAAWEHTNLLPVSADPFVGRRRELHDIARTFGDPYMRCLALHGPGGMGKTALAEAAGRWQHERDRWPDGVWLVELRNVTTALAARNQIATMLGLEPQVAGSDAALVQVLRDWNALLILDDLDMLRENDRSGLIALLGTRFLRLLLTARRGLPGQVTYQSRPLQRLEPEDALRAFQRYAPPMEDWGTWQAADLEALLRFLDGYPFPIRLTATYLGTTRCGLPALRQRLEANPRGTLRYPNDDEDRETSLAATLDLSYQAMPAAAQATTPLLALFPAGLSREAARAILGETAEEQLETLLHYSMAEYRDEAGYQRFALPEPARRYAEALQPADAMDHYAPAALAFFHEFIAAGNNLFVEGKDEQGRLLLTLEQPNFSRFLDWGYMYEQRDDNVSLSARATALLGNYWTIISAKHLPETKERAEQALAAAQRSADQWGEANTLKAIGDVQQFRKEVDAALASYQQALALFRSVGDRLDEANTLAAQSRLLLDSDWPQSQALLEQALALRQQIDDVYSMGADLGNYGIALLSRGRNAEALAYLQRARACFAARNIDHLVHYTDDLIAQAQDAAAE